MSESSQFSISTLGRKRNPGLPEFEALLDLMPRAALLVDAQSLRILSANAPATELSAYTRVELQNRELTALFANMDETALDRRKALEQKNVKLRRRKGASVDLQVSVTLLPPKGKWALLLLDEVNQLLLQQSEDRRKSQFWDSFRRLAAATVQDDLDKALEQALEAAHSITEAGVLAVYLAGDQAPVFQRRTGWGVVQLLPEQLSSQDLAALQKPQLWTQGKRQTSSLQRMAYANQLSFLASAPLGQPKAAIGLVALADSLTSPPQSILAITQVLAGLLTGMIQHHTLVSQLRDEMAEYSGALKFSETIEEAYQEGLLVLLPNLQVHQLNPAAETMLGYSSHEAEGQPVQNILIGTNSLVPALLSAQQGNPTYSLDNMRLYRRYGEAFLARVRVLPVMHIGKVAGVIVLIQDLSEQELIQEKTQNLEQRAMLGEVTAVFAHEVRNPINNISTGLQLMAYNLPENDPSQELITRLQQDCDRLEELMKSVLSFSRSTDYEMEVLDLGLLIQRLIDRLKTRIERSNVKLNLQIEPNCPLIRGNPRALEQVFNNLINNAVQAMSDGGRLALKVQPLQGAEGRSSVEASVADTGPGIPKELQERIFQPFFTTNKNGGTGLGLAISKRIITAHKGNIRLESFPGGTVFYVQLPVVES